MRHKDPELMERIRSYLMDYYLENNGAAPSTGRIAAALGIGRTTAYKYLVAMAERGMIGYKDGVITAAFMKKIDVGYTQADAVGEITGGEPSVEEENLLYRTSLPTAVFGSGPFYILYAADDSMRDAGIGKHDILVIRKTSGANVGDIVVALDENNENTLKRYGGIDPETRTVVLEYMNEAVYPGKKIYVKELVCRGVLSHIIRAV